MELFLRIYDDYLADSEYLNRFGQDPRYHSYKQHQNFNFLNLEIIIYTYKEKINYYQKRGQALDKFEVLTRIAETTSASCFYHMNNDDSFTNWCKNQNLDTLNTFTQWIYEDFQHIKNLKLPYNEALNKVLTSCKLSTSITPHKILTQNQIEFDETTQDIHKEMIRQEKDTDLIELWKKRHSQYKK